MKKARYIRVSTKDQNPARQLAKKHQDELLYIDYASGSLSLDKRPEGRKLIIDVEAGLIDYITFESVDRIGRSTTTVINQLQYFLDKGIVIKIENLGLESMLPDGKPNEIFSLITTILANLSQMEKTTLLERQKAGIEAAKLKNDVYLGRTKGSVESDEVFLAKHAGVVKALKKYPDMSLRELAKQASGADYNPSPNTVKKVKKLLESKNG